MYPFGNSKHKMRLFGTKNSRRIKIMVFLSFSVRTASILIGKIGNMKGEIQIHEVPKIRDSKYVNEIVLLDNHRHESLDEVLRLLNEKY